MYAKSTDGTTIHRTDCRFARLPWLWANTQSPMIIYGAVSAYGYRLCKFCRPLEARR